MVVNVVVKHPFYSKSFFINHELYRNQREIREFILNGDLFIEIPELMSLEWTEIQRRICYEKK